MPYLLKFMAYMEFCTNDTFCFYVLRKVNNTVEDEHPVQMTRQIGENQYLKYMFVVWNFAVTNSLISCMTGNNVMSVVLNDGSECFVCVFVAILWVFRGSCYDWCSVVVDRQTVRQRDRQTDTQADSQALYHCCARVPRVMFASM